LKLEFFWNFKTIIEIPSPKLEQIKKGEGVPIWNGWVGMEGQKLEFKKVTWVGGCDNLRGRTSRNNEQWEDELACDEYEDKEEQWRIERQTWGLIGVMTSRMNKWINRSDDK
jgi:hypothetical protein